MDRRAAKRLGMAGATSGARRSLAAAEGFRVVLPLAFLASVLLSCVAGAGPTLRPFPGAVASEGASYACVLYLDDWVSDPLFAPSDLFWSCPDGGELRVEITQARHLIVRPPTADWFGAAELLLIACNPLGECASQTLSVRVDGTPDPPRIEWIPDQVTSRGQPFRAIDLSAFGWDPDGDAGLSWSAASGLHLSVDVRASQLIVSPRDEGWAGSESVDLVLRDPDGLTAQRTVAFTVTAEPRVTITSLGVEGFLIEGGGSKVLIDALLRDILPQDNTERTRMRQAQFPYDAATVVLASHRHYDHFNAGYAVEYLAHSPSSVFVSASDAVDEMRAVGGFPAVEGRAIGVPFFDEARTELAVAGVRLTAFHLHHSVRPVPNLAFLIEIAGVRILHLGDADPTSLSVDTLLAVFGGAPLRVDVVLAPLGWLAVTESLPLVREAIAPRFAVPIHLATACPHIYHVTLGDGIEVANLCARGPTWIIPSSDAASAE